MQYTVVVIFSLLYIYVKTSILYWKIYMYFVSNE